MDWNLDEENRFVCTIDGVQYIVDNTRRRADFPSTGKYSAYCFPLENNDEEDGFLNRGGKIVCGAAMFCACGLPTEAEFESVEIAKSVCEKASKQRN